MSFVIPVPPRQPVARPALHAPEEEPELSLSYVLLHLAGAVMLLLWAVRMVRTGVERARGAALKRTLQRSKGGWVRAALAGTGIAVLLQSSTAVAILASGFAASGIVAGPVAIAMLLGADFGSALVVQILSFELDWLVPILLLGGVTAFMKGTKREVKQTGRILVGIALVLVSLDMIGEATDPLRHSVMLPDIVGYLSEDVLTAVLIGAVFTWLVHSSIASILLIATLAAEGLVPLELGVSLVLGANVGAGLIAVGLTRGAEPEARRAPLANLVFRAIGAAVLLPLWHVYEPSLAQLDVGVGVAEELVYLHLAFNAALVVLCLPFAGLAHRLMRKALPEQTMADGPLGERTSALDRALVRSPRLALASATREVLHMAELVERMLSPVMDLYDSGDRERMKAIRRMDAEINQAHSDIKLYIAEITRNELEPEDARRAMELSNAAINLEHVGDIVAKGLLKLADRKAAEQLSFSAEGWRELTDLHERVMTNTQLALNVLVSGDLESARQLVAEKDRMRDLERRSNESHLQRLQTGTVQSVETSEIHLETIRALKQINSLFASVAYPILAEAGELLQTRLARSG
ncbi:MAG TPA: Na/Pi cotransporter family protein [Paracoccaceae bacterium]|nr:Na/Pi cotransporter family protein [Paracoccaceae bacterium]